MRVLYSIDVPRLEEILLERIANRPRGGLLDPVLVLVPTLRLASYLKRLIATRLKAVLGVYILTHRGLALRAIAHALEEPPRLLPGAAISALVDFLVSRCEKPPAEYLRAHAGARGALLSTFTDLREALIGPGDVQAAGLSEEECPPLAQEIYSQFNAALEKLRLSGWSDATGLIQASLPRLGAFLKEKRIQAAFHHGAYDLIGIHLELLQTVAATIPTECFLPSELDGRAFGFGRRFQEVLRRRGWGAEPAPPRPDLARQGWIGRLRKLYDPEAGLSPGEPVETPHLEIRHAQGAEAELRAAALRALALSGREGVPLEEITIVARSLEPYLPFLESTFDQLGLPFTSSAALPLSRSPDVAAFLSLLRVLARDFERRAVVDLLRSGRVNLSSLAPKNLDVNRWDRWSRSARIVSGLSAWQGLREFVHRLSFPGDAEDRDPGEEAARRERDGKSVSQLLAILEGLKKEQDAWLAARTFDAHAAFLGGLARRWISPRSRVKPGPEDSLARVLGAIEAAGVAREAAAHVARSGKEPRAEISIEEVEEVMRSAAEARELRIRGEDSGGIRVLDLMQARGLGHRILIWIGFHDGAFPRRAHADYYLGDGAREALAKLSQKPLAKKLEAADEERLLLAMALASAKDRLTLSYQRADDDGQKLARSSALREVARVFTGKPDAGALLRDEPDNPFRPERISSHPGERAVDLATSTRIGMIEPEEAVVGEAVRARKGEPMARAVIGVLRLDDAYKEATLSCVERLERFEPADGSFDGATGIGIDRGRALYPTAIERLARCPLSFFLRDVLGLRELDDEAAPHRIEKHILGSAAHDALAEIYATLERDELFRSKKDPATRAAELIEPLWRKHLEKAAGPSFVRLRGLFALLGDRWLDSLREFVLPDVEEIRKASIQKLETEKHLSVSLSLAEGAEQKLAGRMDRVIRANDSSAWLDDYKTGRVNKKKLEPGSMLRGVHLQLPLYREIVASLLGLEASQVRARLLGVGPDSEEGPVELKTDPEVRKGILETIQVALELAIKGHFPLHRDSQEETYCNYCGYRRTCRRSHEPTRARLEGDPRLADFRDMKRKQKGKPLLANVRAHPDDDGQEGGGE